VLLLHCILVTPISHLQVSDRTSEKDRVFLQNIKLTATVGRDRWHQTKPQPVLLSVCMFTDVSLAAEKDDVIHTIDYGAVCRALVEPLSNSTYPRIAELAAEVGEICLDVAGCRKVEATVRLPKAFLHAECKDGGITIRMEVNKTADGRTSRLQRDLLVVTQVSCIIGVNPHERKAKQPVILRLSTTSDFFEAVTDFQSTFSLLFSVSYIRHGTSHLALPSEFPADSIRTLNHPVI
jgi:FolB domain-containing protein